MLSLTNTLDYITQINNENIKEFLPLGSFIDAATAPCQKLSN